MGEEMPICRILKTGELAGEKHCACKSCEDDSSNDDSSDSNVGDRREFLWASTREHMTLLHGNSRGISAFAFRSLQRIISKLESYLSVTPKTRLGFFLR